MKVIKVATDDGNAYYEIVSRLKATHFKYESLRAGEAKDSTAALVITSKAEAPQIGAGAVAIEDLSEDPIVMEGQLLSRLLDKTKRSVLIGIDPGSRIGMAVFYGGQELGAMTGTSAEELVNSVAALADEVPHDTLTVKIGGGAPESSPLLARLLQNRLPESAIIEIVDESGTSVGGGIGARRDQRAAARIAFRKGVRINPPSAHRRTGP